MTCGEPIKSVYPVRLVSGFICFVYAEIRFTYQIIVCCILQLSKPRASRGVASPLFVWIHNCARRFKGMASGGFIAAGDTQGLFNIEMTYSGPLYMQLPASLRVVCVDPST